MASTPLSQFRFLWAFIAWWLVWSAIHTWVLTQMGYSLSLSIKDSLLSNAFMIIVCFIIINVLKYYQPQGQRFWYLPLLSLACSGLWYVALKNSLPLFISNENNYYAFIHQSMPVRFAIAFLMALCMAMISMLWYNFEDQKQQALRQNETEQLIKEAELFKLRNQLQPHFLFNSLNSINALIGIRPQDARNMVQQLSDFLRGTLKRDEQQWITVSEEIEYLQLYLEIEKVRFGNRLEIVVETEVESLVMKMPSLLLQPLVENAIKFGLYDTVGKTEIKIKAQAFDNKLVITVQNPFDEATAKPRQGTGFGLSSIERRLYLLFGRKDLFTTNTNENIFTATLTIPQLKNNEA